MVETVKKPSSNRSAKERRNTLFRVLDGVLSMAHKKFTPAATVTGLSRDGLGCWSQPSPHTAAYSRTRSWSSA